MQARQGLYAPMSRRVMVVGIEALGASLGEAATGADLGGSSKYSNCSPVEHIQFMYAVEDYLPALPKKEIFGRTAKYINHPNLMPDLYKDLEGTEVDKRQVDHSGMQNDPENHNSATHDYNLHSRMAHRLK